MTTLPLREMVLYKHGVGFFVRQGEVEGAEVHLTFRPEEVNDVLKSLTVFDTAGGKVLGVHYQTPLERTEKLADSALNLSDFGTLRDLLRDLRGRQVSATYSEADKLRTLSGRLVGIDSETKSKEKVGILGNDGQIRVFELDDLRSFRIIDDQAERDLRYFLDGSLAEDNRRGVRVRLSEGHHNLIAYYVAPSPTWRVSYRFVARSQEDGDSGTGVLQGWGIFDNRLDEDLDNVRLTLIAGQPISFVYDLYQSQIPPRPDVNKAYARPVLKEANQQPMARLFANFDESARTQTADATTKDLGELFQYTVTTPVSVKRGESALVPILATTIQYERELVYNTHQNAQHPIGAIRFENTSDLTLERGPVTVVEDNAYKGDALMPFSQHGQMINLFYAVELGISVHTSAETQQVYARLSLENDYLVESVYDVQTVTYVIDNQTGKSQVLTLEVENLANDGYELVDTVLPEADALLWRWRVPLPSRGISQWQYKIRKVRVAHQYVRNLSYQQLQAYMDGRVLEQAVYDHLSELLSTRDMMTNLDNRKTELQAERERIYRQQEQWRQNLSVLKESESERNFRDRLLKQLQASEDRIASIEREVRACDVKKSACEKRIASILETLNQS